MSAIRLNMLDAGFLYSETDSAPNHVGGLLHFRLPDDAPQDFMRQMMAEFRNHRSFVSPWNRRLKYPIRKNPMPVWIEDNDIDLEYHVRHSALPWPGGERELGELIGRLHSQPVDLSRPPWEFTIIEGLSDRRFAFYIKIHHALIDGVSGMKLLQRTMGTEREASKELVPFWAAQPRVDGDASGEAPRKKKRKTDDDHHGLADHGSQDYAGMLSHALGAALHAVRNQAETIPQLLSAFGKMAYRLAVPEADGPVVPYTSPRSILNDRIRAKRRFATQQFTIERMRAVAQKGSGTLNDVVLAVSAGALKRFLTELNALPAESLTAAIPVSVRPADDPGGGNAITFIIATLATDTDNISERFERIKHSVQQAKEHVQSLPKQALEQYTLLLMAPTIATILTGTARFTRPLYNVMISNVPGPQQPLYFRGAELLNCFPVSVPSHGQALNITCQSYNGHMDFGFIGCHATLPSLQKLAVYAADALDELEAEFNKPIGAIEDPDTIIDPAKVAAKPKRKAAAKSPRKPKAQAAAAQVAEMSAENTDSPAA